MIEIIWSNRSKFDYFSNIDFLLETWNETKAKHFIHDVTRTLKIIQESPHIFPTSTFKDVRKAAINKHIQLYYRFESNRIEILRFWNCHQNPKNLKINP